MRAYLIYKKIGLNWKFTIKRPSEDTIFDEVEIELPKGARLGSRENGLIPYIVGSGELINDDLLTIANNGEPHPAIAQLVGGKPVSTIVSYRVIGKN